MFKIFNKNSSLFSLSDDYFSFIWIISRGILIIFALVIYTSFSSLRDDLDDSLKNTSDAISKIVGGIIESHKKVLMHLGNQIVKENATDPHHIARILGEISFLDSNQSMHHVHVAWSTKEHKILASSFDGVPKNSLEVPLQLQSFAGEVFKSPWKAFINPFITQSAFPPYNSMIHLSLAVSKEGEGVIGRLGIGINLDELSSHIYSETEIFKNSFLILDQSLRVMSSSPDFKKLRGEKIDIDPKSGKIISKGLYALTYKHFVELPNTPFVLLVGTNEGAINKNFLKSVFPKVLEVFSIGLLCLIILYIYRKKFLAPITELAAIAEKISKGQFDFEILPQRSLEMTKLAEGLRRIQVFAHREQTHKEALKENNKEITRSCQLIESNNLELTNTKKELEVALQSAQESEDAKEKFRDELLKRSKYHLNLILDYADGAINSLMNKTMHNSAHLKFYRMIYDEALKLKTKTLDVLEVSYIDMNTLIKECLRVHTKLAFDHRTSVDGKYEEDLPKILGDQTSLKHAFINLIEQSISCTPAGEVHIQTSILSEEDAICISIVDNGFGISLDAIESILNHSKQERSVPFLNFKDIEKIIKAHHGIVVAKKEAGAGTIIKVVLPISEHDPLVSLGDYGDNIYPIKGEN